MAGEFLLFLINYGFCSGQGRGADLVCTLAIDADDVVALVSGAATVPAAVLAEVRARGAAVPAERRRAQIEVLLRPGQPKFRRDVLSAFTSRCLLSGESFEPGLQAAHIKPVAEGGPDHVSNAICLRADLHVLYDGGHIRIDRSGALRLSGALVARTTSAYLSLPATIVWPTFASLDFVDWRERYT